MNTEDRIRFSGEVADAIHEKMSLDGAAQSVVPAIVGPPDIGKSQLVRDMLPVALKGRYNGVVSRLTLKTRVENEPREPRVYELAETEVYGPEDWEALAGVVSVGTVTVRAKHGDGASTHATPFIVLTANSWDPQGAPLSLVKRFSVVHLENAEQCGALRDGILSALSDLYPLEKREMAA